MTIPSSDQSSDGFVKPTNRTPLNPEKISAKAPLWSTIRVVPTTGSTNADAKQLAAEGFPDRSAIVASNQTAGRGRLTRQWEAPQDSSIALSALFRPVGIRESQWGLMPLACGLAVVDMAVHTAGIPADRIGLKWPNDVLIDGRKVCGILVEAASLQPPAIIPGIGVNVDLTEDELPVPHAISLAMAGATCTDRDELAAGLLNALHRRELQWRNDAPNLLKDYRAHCNTLGLQVRAELPNGQVIQGTATDVLKDGELVITLPDGSRSTVAAGDVSHLRAADGKYQ